jgi:hypothetical protein
MRFNLFNLCFLGILSLVMSETSDKVDYVDFSSGLQFESDIHVPNPNENDLRPWDASLYMSPNDQIQGFTIPSMSDPESTIFQSSCAFLDSEPSKKSSRGSLCPDFKERNEPLSGTLPGTPRPDPDMIPSDKENSDPEYETSPLSSSVFGLAYWDLCPRDRADDRTPFCCDFKAWGGGAQVAYCFDCMWILPRISHSRLLR